MMISGWLLNLLGVCLVVAVCSAQQPLKVLGLFPYASYSHFLFFKPVLRDLASKGHDVTVVSYFPWKDAPANYHDLVIHGELVSGSVDLQSEWFQNRQRYGNLYEWEQDIGWGIDTCNIVYNVEGVQRIIRERQQFDVILMEHFITDCMMGIAWHLRAPVIAMSTCPMMPWHYNRFGNPMIPSYISSMGMAHSERMTFSQRLFNWIDVYLNQFVYSTLVDSHTDRFLREQFGDTIPPVAELVKTTSLMFVNQHYSFSGSKPLSPAVVELGGYHIADAKPLPADLQQYLDEAVEGVVLVSWGSMVRAMTLPDEKRHSMIRAFGSLEQRILWKWENDTMPDQPSNVRIVKWLPQRDILCHPNVRVFITHGGLMGSSEAAYCGVPMVVTPFFGDQPLNGAAAKNRGMGTVVNFADISTESILAAVNEMLKPESRANAKAVSYVYRNRPKSGRETAVWWVEHVATTGGSPLTKSHAVHMSAWEYHSVDVIAAFALLVLLILAILYGITRALIRSLVCRSQHIFRNKQD